MAQEIDVMKQHSASIETYKANLVDLLPKTIPADRWLEALANTIRYSPSLLKCTPESLREQITKAARSGLYVDGKEAAIVPYNGKIVFTPMVAGVAKILTKAGYNFFANAVYPEDVDSFKTWVDDDGEHILHTPALPHLTDNSKPLFYYGFAKSKDGKMAVERMSMKDLDALKTQSLSKVDEAKRKYTPWIAHDHAMRVKSVVHRLSRKLQLDVDTLDILNSGMEEQYAFDNAKDVTPRASLSSRTRGVAAALAPPIVPVQKSDAELQKEKKEANLKLAREMQDLGFRFKEQNLDAQQSEQAIEGYSAAKLGEGKTDEANLKKSDAWRLGYDFYHEKHVVVDGETGEVTPE